MKRVEVAGDLYHGRVLSCDRYVGRAAPGLKRSRYANPFPAKVYGLDECLRLYRAYMTGTLTEAELAAAPPWARLEYATGTPLKGAVQDLAGHDLACWCPLDQPCHADILIELIGETA
jgi:uncharacterized protein DUF4326